MTNATGLHAHELTFRHPGAEVGLRVPELTLQPGCPTALVGPSGSGKTTLLRLLTGLLQPQSGSIKAGGFDLSQAPSHAAREWRLREAGLIFQDFALLPYLTAEENAMLPTRFLPSRCEGLSTRTNELATKLGLGDHWQKPASILSQGERQRVAIVRALAHRPSFVFADEPTASLDSTRRDTALELLLEDAVERNACLLVITHDVERLQAFSAIHRMEDFLE